jgi:predicted MFS family arabinose efflux permease
VVVWTTGAFLFGFAQDLSGLLTARVMIGLGEAVIGPAGISLLCDYLPPERRARAIAFTYLGATIGASLSFGGGGWLLDIAERGSFSGVPIIGDLSGWRQVCIILASVGIPLFAVLVCFREPPRSFDPKVGGERSFRDLWDRRRLIWPMLLTGLSIALADFAYTTWQTPLLTRTYGLTAGTGGQYLGLTTLIAGTAGASIGGVLSDRAQARHGTTGRVGVIRYCAFGLLLGAGFLLIPQLWAALCAFAIWQVVANIAYVSCAVTLVELVTDRTRAFSSAVSVSLSIGIGLGFGPTSVAFLNQSIGRGENALSLSILIILVTMALTTFAVSSLLKQRLK